MMQDVKPETTGDQAIDQLIAEATSRLNQLEDRRKPSRSDRARQVLAQLAPAIDATLAKGYSLRQALQTTQICGALNLSIKTVMAIRKEISQPPETPRKRAAKGKSQAFVNAKAKTTPSIQPAADAGERAAAEAQMDETTQG